MTPIKILFTLLLIISIFGCSKNNPETEAVKKIHDSEHEEHDNEVALTEDQLKLMEIETTKIEEHNISGYIKASGEVKINPDQESKVGGMIPGRISRINVKEGSFVRAGQVLATIENVDLINVQTEYVEALHEYEHSKKEYERQKTLRSNNIGSEKELSKLLADYEHALVGLRASEQRLEGYRISKNRFTDTTINVQRYFPVTAPISGNVIKRNVTVGQFADPSMDMFYIVNTSTVFVDLNIFEQDIGKITAGQKVIIESASYPGESFEGKISTINKVFDDASRTVRVRVLINNKDGRLLPNMFVTAKIYIKEGNALAVPKSAIEQVEEQNYIYIKTDEKKHTEHEEHEEHEGEHKEDEDKKDDHEAEGIVFKKVQVKTGIEDDEFVEIIPIEAIGENAEVVSKGSFYLKSEMMKGELGEHEH